MEKIYIFSNNNLNISALNTKHTVHKNKCVVFTPPLENVLIESLSNCFSIEYTLNIDNLKNHSLMHVENIENNKLVEIIDIPSRDLLQIISSTNYQVKVYSNSIDVIYKTKVYSYYFAGDSDCILCENNDILLIANNNCVLEFDIKNTSFNLNFCQKTAKNEHFYEFLCKIPYSNVYFLLYKVNLKNNTFTSSCYQKGTESVKVKTLPYVFYHLTKNNFECAKSYLAQAINYDDIKNYFKQFNHIKEIDGSYFLCGNIISKIKFEISNNMIVDVD